MSDSLRKVKNGDPLVIPAGAWNTFVDMARDWRDSRLPFGQGATPAGRSSGIVLVKNSSGGDRGRFDVLGIAGPLFAPGDNLDSFTGKLVFNGVTPTADHAGRFVILLEPLAAGAIGSACAMGVCAARVNVTDEDLKTADIASGDCSQLTTARDGSAAILWAESGAGTVWALVKLAAAPSGTHASPYVLGGSGASADTEEWDIDAQPSGFDGVQFVPFRLFWSGTSGDPVYQFVRTPTYDSLGRLVHVSAEVRTTAFATGPCQS